jgi:hypothetical protein
VSHFTVIRFRFSHDAAQVAIYGDAVIVDLAGHVVICRRAPSRPRHRRPVLRVAAHAFILDTVVANRVQRQSVGVGLIATAADEARAWQGMAAR